MPAVQIIVQVQPKDTPSELALTLQSIETAKQCGIQVAVKVWEPSSPVPLVSFSNALIKSSSFEWLLFVRSGDELTQCGLLMAYIEMIKQSDKKAIYTDKMLRSHGGGIETEFLPDFNHDLLISFPWLMSNHWFFKRNLLLELNGFDESAEQFFELDFILKLVSAQQHAAAACLLKFWGRAHLKYCSRLSCHERHSPPVPTSRSSDPVSTTPFYRRHTQPCSVHISSRSALSPNSAMFFQQCR